MEFSKKPGKLTEEEWALMRRHPEIAYEFWPRYRSCSRRWTSPTVAMKRDTVIRVSSRAKILNCRRRGRSLLAVIDVWDALLSDRPYRPAWPEQRVRDYLRAESRGRHFDPRAVNAFLEMMDRGKDQVESDPPLLSELRWRRRSWRRDETPPRHFAKQSRVVRDGRRSRRGRESICGR